MMDKAWALGEIRLRYELSVLNTVTPQRTSEEEVILKYGRLIELEITVGEGYHRPKTLQSAGLHCALDIKDYRQVYWMARTRWNPPW